MDTASQQAWTWPRIAIVVAAGLELLYWLPQLPALFLRWLSGQLPTSVLPALLLFLMVVIFPVLALWGGALAIKGQNLRRAGWLVAVQPIVLVIGAIAFAASVTILVRHHAP